MVSGRALTACYTDLWSRPSRVRPSDYSRDSENQTSSVKHRPNCCQSLNFHNEAMALGDPLGLGSQDFCPGMAGAALSERFFFCCRRGRCSLDEKATVACAFSIYFSSTTATMDSERSAQSNQTKSPNGSNPKLARYRPCTNHSGTGQVDLQEISACTAGCVDMFVHTKKKKRQKKERKPER